MAQVDRAIAEVLADSPPGLDRELPVLVVAERPLGVVELSGMRHRVCHDHRVLADQETGVAVVVPRKWNDLDSRRDLVTIGDRLDPLDPENAAVDVGATGTAA